MQHALVYALRAIMETALHVIIMEKTQNTKKQRKATITCHMNKNKQTQKAIGERFALQQKINKYMQEMQHQRVVPYSQQCVGQVSQTVAVQALHTVLQTPQQRQCEKRRRPKHK